jgi:hypothetical protein
LGLRGIRPKRGACPGIKPVDLLVVPEAGEVDDEYSALGWMIVPPMMISPQPPFAPSS